MLDPSCLFNLFSANEVITALVGKRISPEPLQEMLTLPAITFRQIVTVSDPTFETSGLQRLRLQVDFWGRTNAQAFALCQAFRQQFNGYQGGLSDETYVQNFSLISTTDLFEEELLQFRWISEYYLYFNFSS
jgi:hypothetical protein